MNLKGCVKMAKKYEVKDNLVNSNSSEFMDLMFEFLDDKIDEGKLMESDMADQILKYINLNKELNES
jgi:hypothetical protein